MPTRNPSNQIAFRYRTVDSATGVNRKTAERLAEYLGVDEMTLFLSGARINS